MSESLDILLKSFVSGCFVTVPFVESRVCRPVEVGRDQSGQWPGFRNSITRSRRLDTTCFESRSAPGVSGVFSSVELSEDQCGLDEIWLHPEVKRLFPERVRLLDLLWAWNAAVGLFGLPITSTELPGKD